MPGEVVKVQVEGLSQFSRALRTADKVVAKQLRDDLKGVATEVAREASALAPRRTGTMAAGYRGASTNTKAVVRNRVLYSRFQEFGFRPGGGERVVDGMHPIGRAIDHQEERIVDGVGDAIEKAAETLGWH